MDQNQDAIVDAIDATFGTEPWLLGDALKKAKTKNAFAHNLRKSPGQIKTTDLKNLVNELWEKGVVEIIPPKDRERSFKYRLKASPISADSSVEMASTPAAEPVAAPEPQQAPDHSAQILEAYQALRDESQFRHVYLADICATSGLTTEIVHTWAAAKARNREFELGQADWSLATPEQRDSAMKINGIHYLTVGLLT